MDLIAGSLKWHELPDFQLRITADSEWMRLQHVMVFCSNAVSVFGLSTLISPNMKPVYCLLSYWIGNQGRLNAYYLEYSCALMVFGYKYLRYTTNCLLDVSGYKYSCHALFQQEMMWFCIYMMRKPWYYIILAS